MKILIIITWVLLAVSCRGKSNDATNNIPSFNLLLSDGLTHINTGDIKAGKPVVLLYFSPDCEHCQKETSSILHGMDSLKEVQFYFITNDSLERMNMFKSVYRLDKYANITVAWDYQFLFPRYFKGAYPPYLALYDRELRQVGVFQAGLEPSKIVALVND